MTAELLYRVAIFLGLLAFFEPCTIATHTLFSQRLHKKMYDSPNITLLIFWLSRSLLLAALLVVPTVILPGPAWTTISPAIPLFAIGLIYLVSRFIYIPVPHLEFYSLLPGGKQLPYALQLALTLPACTIPLVIIMVAAAMTMHRPSASFIAGILFGSTFSLITVVTAYTGINLQWSRFLSNAAGVAPYITAIILIGAGFHWFS